MARKPQPTTLKLLKGNPGKRPINKDEPMPDVEAPDCPEEIIGDARAEWERLVPLLVTLNLLTKLDRAALVSYCITWARYLEAERKVSEGGMVVKINGQVIPNPYLSISNAAQKLLASLISEFGLTPAARTRIKVQPVQKKAASKWSGMLPGKQG